MSTHAERVRELERRVIVYAVSFHERGTSASERDLLKATKELLAARAETCATCEGTGQIRAYDFVGHDFIAPCPAGCDNGRRRER